jgi:DNA-binding Lrp family transcriptional regulator
MTQVEAQIIERTAAGESTREIAPHVGVSPATVQRRLRNPEVRAAIEAVQAQLTEQWLSKSAGNIAHAIEHYRDKAEIVIDGKGKPHIQTDFQLREHGYRASIKVLESVGILASPAPSIFVQQIFNTQVNNFSDAAAQSILDRLSGSFTPPVEGEIIDYDER